MAIAVLRLSAPSRAHANQTTIGCVASVSLVIKKITTVEASARKEKLNEKRKRKKKEESAAESKNGNSETGKKHRRTEERKEKQWSELKCFGLVFPSAAIFPSFSASSLARSHCAACACGHVRSTCSFAYKLWFHFFLFHCSKDWIHVVSRSTHREHVDDIFATNCDILFVFGIRFSSFCSTMDHARRLCAINSVCTTSCLWLWVSLQWIFQCPLENGVLPHPPNYILSHFSLSIRMPHALKWKNENQST